MLWAIATTGCDVYKPFKGLRFCVQGATKALRALAMTGGLQLTDVHPLHICAQGVTSALGAMAPPCRVLPEDFEQLCFYALDVSNALRAISTTDVAKSHLARTRSRSSTRCTSTCRPEPRRCGP